MARPTDQEISTTEKRALMAHHATISPPGEAPCWSEDREWDCEEPLLWFLWKRADEAE